MNKREMLKQRIANYVKWFDRWIEKHDLCKQITILNAKNHTQLQIFIHDVKDERDKLMMMDDRFLQGLGNEFPDFRIDRKIEPKDKYFLGNKIGQALTNVVYIDWS